MNPFDEIVVLGKASEETQGVPGVGSTDPDGAGNCLSTLAEPC